MTTEQKQLIKATVPVLKESGLLLTTHFYKRIFSINPEMKHTFNQGHQQDSRQPTALAMAVLAYAENIDDPSVLLSALQRIGHKHTSLDIRPEHYDLIGQHLLASISEVLGEAATPPLLDAWATAYGQLASLMIGIESNLYAAQVAKPGGWTGWRPFEVKTKTVDSDNTTTLHLYPVDGGTVAMHQPGQYLSIRVFVPQLNLFQPRQFAPTNVPNESYYSIAIKRETSKADGPNGLINHQLRDVVQVGDQLEVSAPAGVCPVVHAPKPLASISMRGCPMHQTA